MSFFKRNRNNQDASSQDSEQSAQPEEQAAQPASASQPGELPAGQTAADSAESPDPTPASEQSDADQAQLGENAGREAGDEQADSAQESDAREDAEKSASANAIPPASREELLARAVDEWKQELAARLGTGSTANPTVDLTHPHPTGAAQLAAGSPTLITSLIREDKAQKDALAHLAQLREKIAAMRARHGYAMVDMAIGELTWTELPPRDPDDQLENSYEETGELKLDPEGIRSRSIAAEEGLGLAEMADELEANGGEEVETGQKESEAAGGVENRDNSPESSQPKRRQTPAIREVREVTEPIIYRTVTLEDAGEDARIVPTASLRVNPEVLRALRDHGTPSRELGKLAQLTAAPSATTEDEVINQVRQLGHIYLPGASYRPGRKLGSFADPEKEILADLENAKPYIRRSGVLAAIAGHEETRRLTSAPLVPADPEDRSPEGERGVGDQDVAELAAVESVATGRDVVVDTPPGSNGVGVKVSVAADAAASGRSVLYVPGRASDARAFVEEMNRLGVGELVVDFSQVEEVPLRLRTGLRQRLPEVNEEATLQVRSSLKKTRRELRNYVAALHEEDPAWEISAHGVLQELTQLTGGKNPPATRVRLAADVAADVRDDWDGVLAQLNEAAQAGAFVGTAGSAWAKSTVETEEEASRAYSVAQRMASETVPLAMEQSQRVAAETGLDRPATVAAWIEQTKMLDGVSATLDVFKPEIYARSVEDMVIATASDEWRAQHGEVMKRGQRRALKKQAKDYVRPGVSVHDMHHALAEVKNQREVWRRYSSDSSWPTLPEGMPMIRATAREVEKEVEELASFLPRSEALEEMPIEDLLALTRALAAERSAIENQPRRNRVLGGLRERGLGELVEDLAQREVEAENIASELKLALTNSVFEQVIARNTVLAELGPAELRQLLESLRKLDKEHTETLDTPVMRAAVSNMRSIARKYREETLVVDARLAAAGVTAIAPLTREHATLMQAARPVWVVSAAAVAHFLPAAPWADLVILDGLGAASLSGAIGPMIRGSQVAIFGDVRGAAQGGALAQLASVLPSIELPAFRSQHDELAIDVLTELGYGDTITAAPSVRRAGPERLTLVDGQGVPSPSTGMIEATAAEVEAVVDAVLDHALSNPGESLAVVSISETHAQHVRQEIDRAVAENPALAGCLREFGPEPFTVVNIVDAVGLRRDSIILTVGFGKTVHGRVLHSFGLLLTPEGVAGLVAAIEAPRREMQIISAIGPGEIDVDDLTGAGPRLLSQLLSRASGHNTARGPQPHEDDATPLEADMANRLRAQDLAVAVHYGLEDGVRIPLAIGEEEGSWKIAVLLDDAAYVAEQSLRRRDRYWPEILEELGWRVYQTYSAALFMDPAGEVERICDLLADREPAEEEAALAEAEISAEVPEVDASTWEAFGTGDDAQAERQLAKAEAESAAKQREARLNRDERPDVTPGLPLAAYSDDQLDAVVTWIASDGLPRTELDFMKALRNELDIKRRGAQIDAVLRNVVRRSGLLRPDGER